MLNLGRTPTRMALMAIGVAILAASAAAQEPTAAGRWRTVDDKTGQAKSIVVIENVDGEFRGRIEKIFAPPAPKADPLCEKCPGERKDKRVVGMTIMWGLKRSGLDYTGGHVFDPEGKKTYKCKLRIIDGGRKLEVRGFIGFSLLGRTQTWIREPAADGADGLVHRGLGRVDDHPVPVPRFVVALHDFLPRRDAMAGDVGAALLDPTLMLGPIRADHFHVH